VLLRERCQFENPIYRYVWPTGLLRAVRRAWRRAHSAGASEPLLGERSAFAEGTWVRVRSAPEIRATLDAHDRTRGLRFTASQWGTCGLGFRVRTVVRRMADDAGRMRPIARTVALDDVVCDEEHGCGRACPLLFRDEWLEAAPPATPYASSHERWARVRSVDEIRATLDRSGRLDGILFMPEMARYAGTRHPVLRAARGSAGRWWRRPKADWYVLAGLHCQGAALAGVGPCNRGCSYLWHRRWLDFTAR